MYKSWPCPECGQEINLRTTNHADCCPGRRHPGLPPLQPASRNTQRVPFDEQLGVDPISKLAKAIDRLAAAIEARSLKAPSDGDSNG